MEERLEHDGCPELPCAGRKVRFGFHRECVVLHSWHVKLFAPGKFGGKVLLRNEAGRQFEVNLSDFRNMASFVEDDWEEVIHLTLDDLRRFVREGDLSSVCSYWLR